ncbi:MAG: nucleoside triphosphate pyrophosphohydrolase [Chlamydiota bacterium]|nr:nucleoside triphosphate pyrophosphohydrolase [Chlamydiota bacterium]
MPKMLKDKHNSFRYHKLLVDIMKKLRGPKGCPWDQKQTHHTLAPCLIEEVYEVIEAIEENNPEKLKEELGDLFLQILFHAIIAEEKHQFDLTNIYQSLHRKLIHRHPHVFSRSKKHHVKNAHEALQRWNKLKTSENKTNHKSSLIPLSPTVPSLIRSRKIQEQASRVGFDWKSPNSVIRKIDEELHELKSAIRKKNKFLIEDEIGDLLFTCVNLSRFMHIDPEYALSKSIKKFIKRFQKMETLMTKRQKTTKNMTLKEWNPLWDSAKKSL